MTEISALLAEAFDHQRIFSAGDQKKYGLLLEAIAEAFMAVPGGETYAAEFFSDSDRIWHESSGFIEASVSDTGKVVRN